MFGRHEKIGSTAPLTEAQIHGILSTIHEIRNAEDQLEAKLREAKLNLWATNVAGHGGSKRGIIAEIAVTLELELPAAVKRREELKATLRTPLSEMVEANTGEDAVVPKFDIRTVDADLLEN